MPDPGIPPVMTAKQNKSDQPDPLIESDGNKIFEMQEKARKEAKEHEAEELKRSAELGK